ncbi:MAG: S9 family peptidase [Burkholderiales bacterium]|nr:S9 family peptidase [Burkholderiales bacterium]
MTFSLRHPHLTLAAAVPSPAAPGSAVTGAARRIPLRDFFRNPEQTAFTISPDGRHLAWLAPWERRLNVFVRPVAGGDAVRVTAETARDIGGYFWKGERIVYVKDFGGDENFHVVTVDRTGGDARDLTPGDRVKADVVDILEDDDLHMIVSHNRRDESVFDVFRVNVETGAQTLIAQNPGNIVSWGTDHDGKLRVAGTSDGVNTSLLYRDSEDVEFRPILTTNFKESVAPLFFTFDNRRLYVASNRGRDKAAIFEFDPATAREGELLVDNDEVDVESLSYSRKRKVLTAARWVTWKVQRRFFDAETEAMFRDVEAKLPGFEVSFTSTNDDEDKFIVAATSDRTPGQRYLYDKTTRELTLLADVAPWLPADELAPMQPITYKARDGLTIHGYLTLPRGVAARDLPVVVNVHGGPWARDVWGFNPEIQFLANRGYAVLQVNFRGSTGYGRAFWEASFREWGRKMQDDVTDGVRWLIGEGIADAKRVAIYGGSYGGYATLAGLAFTPDVYAAGIDYVGVSNLLTFMKAIPPYWKPMLAMLQEMVGDMEGDEAMLRAASPVFHADRITAPLLIAQGANDPRVVKAESDQMVAAMRARGVEVEYLVKDDEGHGFRNEENRFEFYEAMERFLAKHLAPSRDA